VQILYTGLNIFFFLNYFVYQPYIEAGCTFGIMGGVVLSNPMFEPVLPLFRFA